MAPRAKQDASSAAFGPVTGPSPADASSVQDIARFRRTDPTTLSRSLRGDLDWIVMKCLEKDRTRRYETANGLAMDVRRYLASEPIEAGPPSGVYRLRKFVTRNRGPVAAGLAIAIVLMLGTVGTSVGLMRALAAETDAEQRADTLADMVEFLESQLAASDTVLFYSSTEHGKRRTVPILREAAEERERVLGPDSPHTLFSMMLVGNRLARQGKMTEAEQYHRRALDAARGVLADDDVLMISILSFNGLTLHRLGRLDEAEALGAEAVRHARIRFSDPDLAEWIPIWAALMRYGNTLRDMERFEHAEEVLLEAHAARESLLGTHVRPGSPAKYLAELYDAWHASEPDAGYDSKAAEWRDRFRGRKKPTVSENGFEVEVSTASGD